MTRKPSECEPLLNSREVAAIFRVSVGTINRWAKMGKLSTIRTLGGHRRYLEAEVLALREGEEPR